MEQASIIGIDLAKHSFQIHCAAADGSVLLRKKLSRRKLPGFLASQPRCVVAMEACASAHYWGREAVKLGHQVKLIPPIYAKPFVKGQSYQDTSLRHSKIKVFLSRIRRRRGFLLVQSQRDGCRVKRIGRYHPRRALAGLTGGDNATPD